MTRPRLAAGTGITVLALLLFAFPLALPVPLLDPDEGLHAAISQEMVEHQAYITPTFLSRPFLDKPILFFWAQGASLRAFGMNEAAVRFPGLLFGLLGCVTTAVFGWRLLGPRVGALAGCFQATLLLPLAVSQAAVHDVALVPWTNLGLLSLWEAHRAATPEGARRWTAAAGLMMGLAVLTKGLIGVALVCLAFMVWAIWRRQGIGRAVILANAATLIGVIVASPWYLAMERAHPGFLRYYLFERHVLGYLTSTQTHGHAPWWYYGPILIGGGFPWLAYLPLAWRPRAGAEPGAAPLALCWTWLIAGVLFLSAADSKLLTYLLPVFPSVAILAAVPWAQVWPDPRAEARRLWPIGIGAHVALGSLLLLATLLVVERRFGLELPATVWTGGLVVAGAHLALAFCWNAGRRRLALATGLGLVAATFVLLMTTVLPPVAERLSARALAQHLNTQPSFGRVWIVNERIGSVVFYLDPAIRARLTPDRLESVEAGTLGERLRQPAPDVLLAVTADELAKLDQHRWFTDVPFQQAGPFRVYSARLVRQAMIVTSGRTPEQGARGM